MKKLSSNLLLLLTITLVLFSAGKVRANRAAAGEIAYKWVSDSTYLLTYTFYRDCSGATPEPATVNLCYYNTCNTDKGSVTLSKKTPLSGNGLPVPNSCSGAGSTTCSSPAGTLKGFRKWVYEATVTLPSKCASWHFIVSIGDRNTGITNYTVPAATPNLYTEATLNNIDAPTSSSPNFSLGLIQYMCSGVHQNFTFSGTDADGDVLTYTLIDPASATDNQTTCFIPPAPVSYTFVGGTSGSSLLTDPFNTTSTFNLDGSTGTMTFTPGTGAQQALMTMYITKRRGTKIVGTVMRDMQFIVSATCTPAPSLFQVDAAKSVSVLFKLDSAIVCPNTSHTICFDITSPDPTVTISNITDNHTTFSTTSGTSTLPAPYPGAGTNRVSNCFTWTPNETDEGMRYLIIKSEVCKPGNPVVYRLDTIKIYIEPTAKITFKDSIMCLGESTKVFGHPKGPFSWSTTIPGSGTSTGTLGILDPNGDSTVVAPTVTTTYLLVDQSLHSGLCFQKNGLGTNMAEVEIVVVNVRIDAGPDTVMCIYDTLQMNANLLQRQPQLTYKYKWTPGRWLDDSTSERPVLRFPHGIDPATVPDSIRFTLTCTPYPDTTCLKSVEVKVDILKGFYILTGDQVGSYTGTGYMGRQKGVSDTTICAGRSIRLQGWGDQRYEYIWNPSASVSTPTGFIPGTTTLTPPGAMTYTITARRSGCVDSSKEINIQIEPNPTADIGPDRTICFGDTINLFATIVPDPTAFTKYTYSWTPGGAIARADLYYTYFTGFRSEKIKFTVTTPVGCTGTDEAVYTVEPRSFLTVSSDTSICPGDTIQISVAGDALLKSVTWKPLNNIDSVHSLTPTVAPAFSTDYVVVGLDSNQCVDSAIVKVSVLPRPLIYLEDTVTIFPGDVYQLDPSGNCLYYTWFPPVGLDFPNIANPKASPMLNTTYTVMGVSDAGCMTMDSIYILVAPDSYIDIPNAFVPGRGGENTTFKPLHLGTATLQSFTIYNRWGVKLFESHDLNQGWDGSYNGQPQPLGVYVYVLEAMTANKKLIRKQGNVTLVR